jgi:hypothetical protein
MSYFSSFYVKVPLFSFASKLFSFLDKFILIPKPRAHRLPERLIAIYNDFLSDRKLVVQVREPFDQELGCVQGSPSGHLLFNLVVSNINVNVIG